jgi:hypothetical protein
MPALRNPITGIAGCCSRAATGHVTAEPPSRVMNLRRFSPPSAPATRVRPVYRMFSLPRSGGGSMGQT